MEKFKAGLYIRTSTESQAGGLRTQEDRLINFCAAKGYEVYDKYVDSDRSGSSMETRTELERLMTDADNHRFDIVVCTDLDRFARSTKDLLALIERLNTHEIGFSTINESIDTSTSEGELFLTLLAAIAQFERKLILTRLSRGRERAKKEGRSIYRKKKNIPLKQVEDYLKKGLSCNAIAKIFETTAPTIHLRVTNELGYEWRDYRWVKK